jgi:hypothetical protein
MERQLEQLEQVGLLGSMGMVVGSTGLHKMDNESLRSFHHIRAVRLMLQIETNI